MKRHLCGGVLVGLPQALPSLSLFHRTQLSSPTVTPSRQTPCPHPPFSSGFEHSSPRGPFKNSADAPPVLSLQGSKSLQRPPGPTLSPHLPPLLVPVPCAAPPYSPGSSQAHLTHFIITCECFVFIVHLPSHLPLTVVRPQNPESFQRRQLKVKW